MEKTKTKGFYFKCSPEEMDWIERRMSQPGIKCMVVYFTYSSMPTKFFPSVLR
jgi:hypothetical protein